ncbi:MAG: CCA tRNA nucleotidyltransferase [Thermoguttaceae bacterium]|jgi:tRNA nucleotidyltransferase/poly(A) polymerase
MVDPEHQRHFALDVVRRLRTAGFEAYWAGGCVRDELLGRKPKDYDVATNATPPEIRALFGNQRTLPLGAAFGVITVLGPRLAGMIEVATFRQDAEYSDGRHPDRVTFSSAREDAARRDFTINGMFFDPVDRKVIDFVGGQADLQNHLIRAIGSPRLRFGEDKLRMLRAVRFTAAFGFSLDVETAATVREMAHQIMVVSPERIAMEMRRLLTESGRVQGVRLLVELGLAEAVLPEIVPRDETSRSRAEHAQGVLGRLQNPSFSLALAALLAQQADAAVARDVGLRWKLSNKETDEAAWLVEHRDVLAGARLLRWSKLQPVLAHPWSESLVTLHEASSPHGPEEAAYCRELLAQPREKLDPPSLLTGDDLRMLGLQPGPKFKTILQAVRNAQLDGEIRTKEEAVRLATEISEGGTSLASPTNITPA